MRNDQLIEDKFPRFWQALGECIREDAGKIGQNFPDEQQFNCEVVPEGEGITIRRKSQPFRNVTVYPNLKAHEIHILKATDLDTIGRTARPERETLRLSIVDESLEFSCGTKRCRTAADFSKYLFSFVCECDFQGD